jgi:hypothetical protein
VPVDESDGSSSQAAARRHPVLHGGPVSTASTDFPSDGQIFQVIAGLLTGFGGAFLAFARKELGVPDEPASGAQRTIDTVTTTVTAKNVTIPPQETK